jgi:hypothetical protein
VAIYLSFDYALNRKPPMMCQGLFFSVYPVRLPVEIPVRTGTLLSFVSELLILLFMLRANDGKIAPSDHLMVARGDRLGKYAAFLQRTNILGVNLSQIMRQFAHAPSAN